MLNVISLGAGVQSTTLLLLAEHGEITPRPDLAIFSDTMWEPEKVYAHLRWLRSGNVTSIPIEIVSAGDLRADTLAAVAKRDEPRAQRGTGKRFATPPFFTKGGDGREAMLRRQCTDAYKVEPLNKKLRALLGAAPGRPVPKGTGVSIWIGISTDEFQRAKPSRLPWIERRWPLIELGMSRNDCLKWLERKGYPRPPKSSCIGCPFHSNHQWREMRDHEPAEWKDAVAFDDAVRKGTRSTKNDVFLHRQLKPLEQVDLRTDVERGQGDMFGNECEGMCGGVIDNGLDARALACATCRT